MTEQELRALVRDAIARHASADRARLDPRPDIAVPAAFLRGHASHALFTLPASADSDGACIIVPSVQCNHCGYCKSYGH